MHGDSKLVEQQVYHKKPGIKTKLRRAAVRELN